METLMAFPAVNILFSSMHAIHVVKPEIRLVAHYLIGSHEKTLASITPHQTPRRPRKRLNATYKAAIKNAPVRKPEKISHSKVENVLYAPTKPTGTRNLQAGFMSVRLPRKAREKPMITQAVMLITNVPYGNFVPMRPAT